MAQQGLQLDQKKLSCSICLDLLKDPVTIPCGHSYCMSCIKGHWDEEDGKKTHSCPQCRQTFTPRPVLVKNTMLSDLVEELKKTGLQAAPELHCEAGPEDVACDVCTNRKLKAVKSCLQCLVSYCDEHLQPHYESAAFGKHKLVEPSRKLQENVCNLHGKVRKVFCRTDQLCICIICCMDEHKDHETVSAAAERAERQAELGATRQKIQQTIREKENNLRELLEEVDMIDFFADEAVRDCEKTFYEMIRLMKSRSSEVKQQIRCRQKTEKSQVKELKEALEKEIGELKRKDLKLEQLSKTEDHTHFLHRYPSLCHVCESTASTGYDLSSLQWFKDTTATVSQVKHLLHNNLTDVHTKISQVDSEVDILQPKTRAEFLEYSCQVTLDPNTANAQLELSEGNRKATVTEKKQSYPSHDERFTDMFQVLSRGSLAARCYWEVERGQDEVSVAAAYKSVSRTGYESGFGNDDVSWALECFSSSYQFRHRGVSAMVSGPVSSRIGVFLDHRAGILCFYGVSDTVTLLHRVQTTFTQPLHQGLGVFASHGSGSAAEFIKLK